MQQVLVTATIMEASGVADVSCPCASTRHDPDVKAWTSLKGPMYGSAWFWHEHLVSAVATMRAPDPGRAVAERLQGLQA